MKRSIWFVLLVVLGLVTLTAGSLVSRTVLVALPAAATDDASLAAIAESIVRERNDAITGAGSWDGPLAVTAGRAHDAILGLSAAPPSAAPGLAYRDGTYTVLVRRGPEALVESRYTLAVDGGLARRGEQFWLELRDDRWVVVDSWPVAPDPGTPFVPGEPEGPDPGTRVPRATATPSPTPSPTPTPDPTPTPTAPPPPSPPADPTPSPTSWPTLPPTAAPATLVPTAAAAIPSVLLVPGAVVLDSGTDGGSATASLRSDLGRADARRFYEDAFALLGLDPTARQDGDTLMLVARSGRRVTRVTLRTIVGGGTRIDLSVPR